MLAARLQLVADWTATLGAYAAARLADAAHAAAATLDDIAGDVRREVSPPPARPRRQTAPKAARVIVAAIDAPFPVFR